MRLAKSEINSYTIKTLRGSLFDISPYIIYLILDIEFQLFEHTWSEI